MAQIAPVLPQPALKTQNLRKKIKFFKIKGILTFRNKILLSEQNTVKVQKQHYP